MAEVTLTIGDRRHTVMCRDGEEANVERLGKVLDERWPAAQRASGGLNGERTMLFIALMLADALVEADERPPMGSARVMLDRIADHLESIATALEDAGPSA